MVSDARGDAQGKRDAEELTHRREEQLGDAPLVWTHRLAIALAQHHEEIDIPSLAPKARLQFRCSNQRARSEPMVHHASV